MGLFRDVGRRFQRFKEQIDEAKRDEVSHRCTACDATLYTDHEECPECGEDGVEPIDSEETGGHRSADEGT